MKAGYDCIFRIFSSPRLKIILTLLLGYRKNKAAVRCNSYVLWRCEVNEFSVSIMSIWPLRTKGRETVNKVNYFRLTE